MRIAIGSDHRGYKLKHYIKENLSEDIKWIDVGTNSEERTDYPLFTLPVCLEVLQGIADYGILLCGTGVGMSIAANRISNIYAGIAWNEEVAIKNKEDDNVNVLILPADFISLQDSLKIINAWLNANFKEGRYKKRIDMIDAITDDSISSNSSSRCC